MSYFASSPGGYDEVGWKRVAAVTVAFCIAPVFLGMASAFLVQFLGPDALGDRYLHFWGFSNFAIFSPILSWPVWAVIGIGTVMLLRRNAYGAGSAVCLGAGAGALAGALLDSSLGLPLGVVFATLHRFALAMMKPTAF